MKSPNFSSAALAAILLLAAPLPGVRAAVPADADAIMSANADAVALSPALAPARVAPVRFGAAALGEFRPLHLLHAGAPAPAERSAAGAFARPDGSGAALLKGSDTDVPSAGPKSSRKALLYSLLLPGAGELYLGHRGRATGFFVAEGGIWANYAAWQISGHLRKNDYIEQAQINAGIGVSSASDDYWRLVGQYQRSSGTGPDAYEETLRREARLQYPSDPFAQDQYVAQRLPVGKSAWSWSSPELQDEYLRTRRNANRAFDHAKISFALAVLNRLVSAVDTQVLSHSRHADEQSSRVEPRTRVLTSLTADGGGALLIQRRF